MLIVGLDFETTGLDVKADRVIEVGAVLWCTERKAPLRLFSEMINPGIELSPEITALTGISTQDLERFGQQAYSVFLRLTEFLGQGEAVLAHNGKRFDFPLYWEELKRMDGVRFSPTPLLFIDSSVDVDYPAQITTRKLTHLAAEHGFLNPFAHRAVFDVLTMLSVVSRYDWEKVVANAKTPDITIQAVVSYDRREEAKARGFRWDGDKKAWLKVIKEPRFEEETKDYPFRCAIVERLESYNAP